jgi:hypothetical protein
MSSGARLILTNSCLTSLPTYTMGFYTFGGGGLIRKWMGSDQSSFGGGEWRLQIPHGQMGCCL